MEGHEEYGTRTYRHGPSLSTVVLVAIVFGVLAGFGGTILALWANQHNELGFLGGATASATGSLPVLGGGSQSFVAVADFMDESVVNINTQAQQENPYSFFFGGGTQIVQGLGTGIIVDPNGYILTNFHVVGDADNITVTVMHKGGKRKYKAELVGGDKQEDLALIKIKASGLRAVRFGNSDALRPGEQVMAIGNPFGFEHTVSVGVVSALNRNLPVNDSVTLRNMIQTDASINPGNSGGPLVNTRGEVVGINSAVYVGQGGNEPQARGIGFSIPSNHAKSILERLRKRLAIPHPFIGISYTEITDEIRAQRHVPFKDGILIADVLANGPAAKAGLKRDDIVIAIDGKQLADQNVLSDYVNKQEVGKIITLDVRRWDAASASWTTLNVRVKIENKPAGLEQGSRGQSPNGADMTPVPDQQSSPRNEIPFPFPF